MPGNPGRLVHIIPMQRRIFTVQDQKRRKQRIPQLQTVPLWGCLVLPAPCLPLY